MVPFLNDIAACASFIAGILFLRSWRTTADRLFLWFAVAFWMFAANWAAVSLFHPANEARHWFYVLRLVGFATILIAIVDKNREPE
ncbi:MAG TPA: DUF5985 family protein [Vicinamibacterales bacterium]|nr:DUF5985 family protein [Vicinamibacterales bacterium]